MGSKTVQCKNCGQEIAADAKICPNCGVENKKPVYKKWWFWVIVVIVIGALGAGGGSKSKSENDASIQQITSVVSSNSETEIKAEENDVQTTASSAETTKPEDNVPSEYKSALKKANTYSEYMNMSKAAIYNQLTSEYGEKFTEEAAQYAMENIEADWNENALKSAESYSKTMHMSKTAIYDQLVSEYGGQFTVEEAQYAIDNLSADYKANALESAKSYRDIMDMSPAAIYDQLVSEYGGKFTAEEAQYAIDNLD